VFAFCAGSRRPSRAGVSVPLRWPCTATHVGSPASRSTIWYALRDFGRFWSMTPRHDLEHCTVTSSHGMAPYQAELEGDKQIGFTGL